MSRPLSLAGLVLVLMFGALWAFGGLSGLAHWLADLQRAAQDQLAGAIRALRAGEPGALTAFWALCFGYGVAHAAGPGHGKLVIGGYAMARRVPVWRLAGLALASSLAQAGVAVAVVYALVAMLGLARTAVQGAAEDWLTPVGHAMIAGLGLWLVWRGVAGLRVLAPVAEGHEPRHDHRPDHTHHHSHHHHGPNCGHAHGPTLEQAARVTGWRDGLLLVAGIAARPCAGALFVLVLTWQLGIALAGVVGAVVMGLGTATVTVGVALLAAWAREGLLSGVGAGRLTRALPILELTLGAVIAVAALGLLVRQL